MKKVHNSLRGKYGYVIIIGLFLGAAGGYFGFKSQHPIYRGEALIHIKQNVKGIEIGGSSGGGYILNFEELLQSEAMMMTSRRVIQEAMKSELWKDTGMPNIPAVQTVVATNLTAEHPSRTELIRIFYTDKNPEVCSAVVKAITLTYETFARARSSGDERLRLKTLEDRKVLLSGQLNTLDLDIYTAARESGSPNLDALYEAKLAEVTKLESRLNEVELAYEIAVKQVDAKAGLQDMSVSKIAMIDLIMRGHVIDLSQLENQISVMQARGVLTENAQMKQLLKMRELKQAEINKYAAEWRDFQIMASDDPSLRSNGGFQTFLNKSPKVIKAELDALRIKHDKLKNEMQEVGKTSLKLQNFQKKREDIVKDLGEVSRRIDVINMENAIGNRMTVQSSGDVPATPFKDRRKMFGAAGALGGFGLPLMIFVFFGLMNKKFRYSDEASDGIGNVPLLGILPRLPDHLSDPEQAAIAAHCIHQIRIMLQVGPNPEKRRIFMVTSASTGDGKTSLTMALGLSFAAAGSKTLVIDCDMVGQGLTHRLKADNVPGLIETLSMGTLRGHVRKTASKGLYVLPIGNADAVHAGVLSPQAMKRLLVACREHFDIIVIDTGPILGSLEASVVATEADGVIMAVARGQNQPLVEKALKYLRTIGANVMGIVFNRAEQRDFQRSVPSASIRSLNARPNEMRPLLPESDESNRFGPLARSVASSLPPGHNSGNGHGESGA